jgi:sterol desaturase/sphingolipid hydroxylase (fatty acid hydroxylase superfamily)
VDTIIELFNLKAFLIVAIVFIPLERLRPVRPDMKLNRKGWKTDAAHMFLNGILYKGTMLVAIGALTFALDLRALDPVREAVARQPDWLQAIEMLLLGDLGFYWAHRALHHFPVLWKFHSIHHSIEKLDWLAAYRTHVLDQSLVKATSMLPFIIFQFSEWALFVFFVTYQWQSILLHSNIALGFGPLSWLIASPNFHHWHHSNQREAYDKNFSGQLSLWDYVFGTAYLPKGQWPAVYGIDDPVPSGYIGQLLYPFRSKSAAAASEPQSVEAPSPRT